MSRADDSRRLAGMALSRNDPNNAIALVFANFEELKGTPFCCLRVF